MGGAALNYLIMALSLLVSTMISVVILKKKKNNLLSMLAALCLNMLILVGAMWISYSLDEEAQVFGLVNSGQYTLIFAIPIITWINFFILQFVKHQEIKAQN